MVFEWAALHQRELLRNWHRLHNEQPAERIRPLEYEMIMPPRIKGVRHAGEYRLELRFTDGTTSDVDLRGRIAARGGVFLPLQDVEFFKGPRGLRSGDHRLAQWSRLLSG